MQVVGVWKRQHSMMIGTGAEQLELQQSDDIS
jgi:hypothetical protein